mmetsp:Transcript_42932/g.71580  ORF Transcript_42932/g.71580 Transcript_42932/m.71580 type:complete len:145 (-) Transcript_42932:381-815(-)
MGLEVMKTMEGTWLCTDVSGSFEQLLATMGVGWVKRKAAATFGYGKGKAIQVITVEGDTVTVLIKGVFTMTNTFTIGGVGQPGLGPDMSAMTCDATLEEDVVVLSMTSTSLKPAIAKRYIREDGKMVQEFSCEGVTGWRVLTKQ